ncbi:MAG TPA: hypothetical protein DCO75_09830 [Fibrobacteres bacterium]|jgi:hypothetical protein|nr:hypothetical protein [Fibrobacterota bacterium]
MNLSKNLFGSLASGLFIVSLCMTCSAEQPKQKKQTAEKQTLSVIVTKDSTVKAPAVSNRSIIVYYFHGNVRCPTCFKLESFAKSEVEADFADAIKEGTLVWKTVNVEDKGNEHFNDDYKLYTKSVIISTVKDGKQASWKNLDKIWEYVHEEPRYRDYIKNEVKACLEGKCL